LTKEPAKTPKIKESKQYSTFTSPLKSITPRMHKPKVNKPLQTSIGPTLFELHNVTPTHMDVISQLLGTNHINNAVLIPELFLITVLVTNMSRSPQQKQKLNLNRRIWVLV
jgi:hypothetical protein